MSNETLEARITAVGADGSVSADEVMFLRRTIFADGVVSTKELDALFALAERAPNGDPEWPQYFAEAAADFYLREEEPHGYLTPAEFETLKDRVMKDGGASALKNGLLVKLMETATQTTPEMAEFVGEQIKQSIIKKDGGAVVDKKDAMLLRRYLFAMGGCGAVAVTRKEAELLFDINDAVGKADNDPAWSDLFVIGIVNHLMAHLGYEPPSREEAFRRHAWVSDHSVNVGGFFKRMFSGGVGAVRDAYTQESVTEERNKERAQGAAFAEQISQDEADWLAARIGRDGVFDNNERQLIDRMRELEADLPKTLKELVSRAA
ncbi:MAG: hypothetical protein HKN14_15760 [Marinicaulis sp.]|nr:hypothetical protein [Marinicaulis sp.]